MGDPLKGGGKIPSNFNAPSQASSPNSGWTKHTPSKQTKKTSGTTQPPAVALNNVSQKKTPAYRPLTRHDAPVSRDFRLNEVLIPDNIVEEDKKRIYRGRYEDSHLLTYYFSPKKYKKNCAMKLAGDGVSVTNNLHIFAKIAIEYPHASIQQLSKNLQEITEFEHICNSAADRSYRAANSYYFSRDDRILALNSHFYINELLHELQKLKSLVAAEVVRRTASTSEAGPSSASTSNNVSKPSSSTDGLLQRHDTPVTKGVTVAMIMGNDSSYYLRKNPTFYCGVHESVMLMPNCFDPEYYQSRLSKMEGAQSQIESVRYLKQIHDNYKTFTHKQMENSLVQIKYCESRLIEIAEHAYKISIDEHYTTKDRKASVYIQLFLQDLIHDTSLLEKAVKGAMTTTTQG